MIYTQNNNLNGAAYMVATRIWQLNNLITQAHKKKKFHEPESRPHYSQVFGVAETEYDHKK